MGERVTNRPAPYWVTFATPWPRNEHDVPRPGATAYATSEAEATEVAERMTGATVTSAKALPQFASGWVLNAPEGAAPPFCYSPERCVDLGHCPGHRSCCD